MARIGERNQTKALYDRKVNVWFDSSCCWYRNDATIERIINLLASSQKWYVSLQNNIIFLGPSKIMECCGVTKIEKNTDLSCETE